MKISNQDIEKELLSITSQFLLESGSSKRDIKMNASLQRHLGIDSLGRAELFRRIEKAFDVSIPDRLLAEAETLEDMTSYLKNASSGIKNPSQSIATSHNERSTIDPSQTKTLIEVLLLYGQKEPDKAHVYFQNEDGFQEIVTYGELLKASLQVAAGLRQRGLKENETVAIMQPTHLGFFYTFLGTLLAGGIPVPIYPPFRMHMLEAYAKTEAHILRNAEVRILVTFDKAEKLSLLLQSFVPSLKHVTTVDELRQPQELDNIFKASGHSFAFIQYTSGSTSDPKGVLLTHDNLISNIKAYGHGIKVTPDDVVISWLPLYHDMGLIGMWLGSLYYGVPLVLLTPFSFLNHPEKWLWAMHNHGGTISGAPNFAYELCVRKVDPAVIEGLDLSTWRLAANGAEKVYPRTLDNFAKKFAPYGFKRRALLPVYGLAESTVALLLPPLDRDFLVDKVDRTLFEEKRQAVISEEVNALEFVSCGLPIQHHEVRIVDDDNQALPERMVGNLQFRGPSNMQSYYRNPIATQAIYHEGWIDSGDLAYQADKEFYITGRRKDLIIKAGRNIYPAEIEELVGTINGVRQGCVIAFEVNDTAHGTEQLVIVAETREKEKMQRDTIVAAIQEAVATALDIVPDDIVLVSPQIVPKTSSGKLQRSACKSMYAQGQLGKRKMPAWLQILKLSAHSLMRKCTTGVRLVGKFFYTAYLTVLVVVTSLPVFFIIKYSSRDYAAKACQTWATWILRFTFCPIHLLGREKLINNKTVIYAPNHASYLDAIIMMAILPIETRFVAKRELLKVPILRTIIRRLDYLAVDRLDFSKGMEDTKHIETTLAAGHPILIFPEGTFGYSSGLRPFRLGAFKIAAEASVPICPIALKGTRQVWRDDEKLLSPHPVTVTICDFIQASGSEWQHVTQLRDSVRAEISKYCGEASLDFIVAQTVAPKKG